MSIIIVNGSPRHNGNTAALCNSFAEGVAAAMQNVEVEQINLYSLNYTGCRSCFGCKLVKGSSYGRCAVKDGIYDLLQRILFSDGFVLGTPLYFGNMAGQMRCFLERLLFPLFTYEKGFRSAAPKKIPVTILYTMNATKQEFIKRHYDQHLFPMETDIAHVFMKPELVYAFNTYQFRNYTDYKVELFSEKEKSDYREHQFPMDLAMAFEAGKRMAASIKKES